MALLPPYSEVKAPRASPPERELPRTRGIVSGPDGKLWFVEPDGPIAVGRLDPNRLIATGALPPADDVKTAAGERR